MTYTLGSNANGVRRDLDGAMIPADPANVDWRAYEAWLALGNTPTPTPGPTVAALTAYAAQAWANWLAADRVFDVAPDGAPPVTVLCDGTNATRADLALLALSGQANPAGTKSWIDNSGVTTTLTGAQCVALANAVGEWISNTYSALASLLAAITATSPTVTTMAQIDAFAWPTT